MTPRTGFDFHLDRFPSAGLETLRPWFDRLPLDPYITGSFRRRRFSRFHGRAGALRRLDHAAFLQSKAVNQLAGGMKREFQELEPGLVALPVFHGMVGCYLDFLRIDPEATVLGVHQIRILCSPGCSGDPAPEGIHKDGFDYVGIFCVERHDIVGADTHLYRAKDQPPVFSRALQPGEVVFTDDRAIFHYTDPVRPSADHPGHRDVFVITA